MKSRMSFSGWRRQEAVAEERVEQVDELGRSLVIVGFVGEESLN